MQKILRTNKSIYDDIQKLEEIIVKREILYSLSEKISLKVNFEIVKMISISLEVKMTNFI